MFFRVTNIWEGAVFSESLRRFSGRTMHPSDLTSIQKKIAVDSAVLLKISQQTKAWLRRHHVFVRRYSYGENILEIVWLPLKKINLQLFLLEQITKTHQKKPVAAP